MQRVSQSLTEQKITVTIAFYTYVTQGIYPWAPFKYQEEKIHFQDIFLILK